MVLEENRGEPVPWGSEQRTRGQKVELGDWLGDR